MAYPVKSDHASQIHCRLGRFCRLRLNLSQSDNSKSAPDAAILRPKGANPDEIPRHVQELFEHIFRDGLIDDCEANLAFPLVNDREALHDPFPAAGHAIGWDEAPLAFYFVLLDGEYDGILDHHARLDVLGIGGVTSAWNLFAFVLCRRIQGIFESEERDDDVAFGIAVQTLAPGAFFIVRIGLSIEPRRSVISAERNRGMCSSVLRRIFSSFPPSLVLVANHSNSLNEIGVGRGLRAFGGRALTGGVASIRSTTLMG